MERGYDFSYMPYWRAVDTKVEGASQRIQEDAMNFCKNRGKSWFTNCKSNNVTYCFSSNTLGTFIECSNSFLKISLDH